MLLLAPIFILLYLRSKKKLKLNSKRLIVVVTGCDSGFGLTTTEILSKLGFQVVAACLTKKGMDHLKGRVTLSLKCDVTNAKDVTKLRDSVENAVIRQMMDVNYFGLANVTRALLPMLKRCERSRIINLSSVAGFASGGIGMSGYFELAFWNVHVCNINPGFMRTPLIESTITTAMRMYKSSSEKDPSVVVSELVNAVFYAHPAANIYPGIQAKAMIFFSHIIPRELQIWIIQQTYFLKVPGPKREIVRALQQ
eukprot:gene27080-35794_t